MTTRQIRTVALLAALSAPASAGAFFWTGPGCFMANLLGMGNFAGGVHFSIGAGGYGAGLGPGYPYGYPWPGGPPHPFAYTAPMMSPAPPPPSRPARSARDILEANIWSDQAPDLQRRSSGDRNPSPSNRWQHGR